MKRITREEALRLALLQNRELLLEVAKVNAAEASIGVAEQLKNPTLEATRFRFDDANDGGVRPNIGLQIPIPRPGTRAATIHQAELSVDVARAELQRTEARLGAEVERGFLLLDYLESEKALLRKDLELQEGHLEALGERVRLGTGTEFELSLGESAVAEAEEELERAKALEKEVEAELAVLVDAPAGCEFVRETAWAEEMIPEGTSERRTDSTEAHPELLASEAARAQAEAGLFVARNSVWPWFRWVEVGYLLGPNAGPTSWNLGVSVEVPLLSLHGGDIAEAEAKVREASAREELTWTQVRSRLELARGRVDELRRRVLSLRAHQLAPAELAATRAREALEGGALDEGAAFAVEQRVLSLRRKHLALLRDLRVAEIELRLEAVPRPPR